MRRGGISSAFVLFLAGLAGACSSAAPPASGGASTAVLLGTYTSASGSIAEIVFYDPTHYALWTSPCKTGDDCLQFGTFALSDDATLLSLTDAETGKTETLPFQVEQAASDDPQADGLRPLGLGQGLTNGAGSSLDSSNGNLEPGQVQSAVMNGDDLQLVNPTPVALVSSNPCVFTKSFSGSPQQAYQQVQSLIQQKGGTLTGTASSGSFSVSGVQGTYSVSGNTVTVNVNQMPWLASCSMVANAMGGS